MVLTVGKKNNLRLAQASTIGARAAGPHCSTHVPLKICLLLPVLAETAAGAPVGNAYDLLAAALAAAGHQVEVIYLPGHYCPVQNIRFWTDHYRNMRIDFVPLPEVAGVRVEPSGPAHSSYRLLQYLLSKSDGLDIVHCPLWPGAGYHSMLAKHQGWALSHTRFVVGLDPPTPQAKWGRRLFLHQVEELEADFMQRQMVQMADALWSADPLAAASQWGTACGPGLQPITPACDPAAGSSEWLSWHDCLLDQAPPPAAIRESKNHAPPTLVSVCVSHFNRPALLAEALESIRRQDYPRIEVVLCDDGSTEPAALGFLDSLKPEFSAKGWKIIRQKNRYLGAARNAAARAARGEYLLFMDDDDIAQSDEISVFMQVVQSTGADILTCSMERFSAAAAPAQDQPPRNIQVFLGPAVAAGAFRNVFGPANALVRRGTMQALGGFGEEFGVGFEDWEFFARAVLRGFHLETIPRRLFWYRMHPRSMCESADPQASRLRVIQPYLQAAPAALRELLLYAHGTYHTWQCGAPLPFSHGQPQTPQAFVDDYWQSASWRSTRIFRNVLARLAGRPREARPVVHTTAEAWQVVNGIQQSISWNITGPFRALRRILRRGRWPLYAWIVLTAGLNGPLNRPTVLRAVPRDMGYCRQCLRRPRRLGRLKTPRLWAA